MSNQNKNIEAIYELSPMQQGMLFHSIYNEESTNYFEQLSVTLVGNIDVSAIKKSWQILLDRHSVLRTSFVYKNLDKMLQVVHKKVELPFVYNDCSNKDIKDIKVKLNDYLVNDKKEGFDLNKAPLMRVSLIKLSDNEYKLIWSHHHLLLDGWSMPIVMQELFLTYENLIKGKELHLPAIRPYRDYIKYLKSRNKEESNKFWKSYLKGFNEKTPISLKTYALSEKEKGYKKTTISFTKEQSQSLLNVAKTNKITLNTLMQAGWAILLHKYSNSSDVVFGATVSGRPAHLDGAENMVGLFINTLPIRAQISNSKNIINWIKDFSNSINELKEYEHSALVDIHKACEIPAKQNLFDTLFVFENYPTDISSENTNSSFKLKDFNSFEETNYPLTIVSAPGELINIDAAFDIEKNDEFRIDLLLNHYKNILMFICSNLDKKINEIDYLSKDEKKFLLPIQFSEPEIPEPLVLYKLFEIAVNKYPNKTAVKINDKSYTYKELNIRANALANLLVEKEVTREDLICVYIDRNLEMIVAILGILKSGAGFVPIDPSYPQERINHILEDSKPNFLITEDKYLSNINFPNDKIILISNFDELVKTKSTENLDIEVFPENIAYIIYTSGSTGKPKGTVIQNKSVVNFLRDFINSIGIKEGNIVLQFASIGFDASIPEIFSPLVSGGITHLIPKATINEFSDFKKYIISNKVSNLSLPPSYLDAIDYIDSPYLESIVSAGEKCSWNIVEKWGKQYRFVNGYGPTEASVGCSWGSYSQTLGTSSVPIGLPIYNVKVYVLNKDLAPTPIGVIGELYIGEKALSRGYLNKPDLTAEKFIPDPFTNVEGDRIYKSNDLVKVLPDGQIEFIGRVDHQIKLRGFRIEIGEIETVLKNYEQISQAVVILKDEKLVALVIPENGDIDIGNIRKSLKLSVPDFMIPSHFEIMESFPINSHGKIDRKKLEEYEISQSLEEGIIDNHLSATEDLLLTLVMNILKVNNIQLHQNFFELGGHSLLATQLASRIRESFNIELPINLIFEKETIRELAREIDKIINQGSSIVSEKIKKHDRGNDLQLSFSQQRMWFLQKFDPNNVSNNIFNSFTLKGELDVTALNIAINNLIKRHEILRTNYLDDGGKPIQKIEEEINYNIPFTDISTKTNDEQILEIENIGKREANKVFDLTELPLFSLQLIKKNNSEHVLMLSMHHIISDGWSINITMREIVYFYKNQINGKNELLPELDIQYADFAQWQKEWLTGENLQKQLDYWVTELNEIPKKIEIPTDRVRPSVQTFNGANLEFEIDEKISEQFNQFSKSNNYTPFMVALTSFNIVLKKYANQNSIVVGSPIANRNREEIENIIGMFVNTLVLRTDFKSDDKIIDVLKRVRTKTLKAYLHQDIPFEQLVDKLQPTRDSSHSPLFQIAFVYQNSPTEALEFPELTVVPNKSTTVTAKYDMTVYLQVRGNKLFGTIEYNTDLFNQNTIEQIKEHFITVLNEVTSNIKQKIANISLLSANDYEKIVYDWNNSKKVISNSSNVPQVFKTIVEKNLSETAVTFSQFDEDTLYTDEITYREINEKSNQLARYLIEQGIKSEDLVGVSLKRSPELIISIFAILKAGGAFVPIDPAYPTERISYMINDSKMRFLISENSVKPNVLDNDCEIILLDKISESLLDIHSEDIDLNIDDDRLAYIIYTSGSTGKPKGTLLHHKGLVNLAAVQQKEFNISNSSKVFQFSSLSFDAFVWETVMALLNGASLNLVTREIINSGELLAKTIKLLNITTITLPPSVLSVIPSKYSKELSNLKTIIVAGEKCSVELARKWNNNRQFVNAYGPTETTVCASMFHCSQVCDSNPPIGKPINNFSLYILDENLYPVPIGVPGELYIAGSGLARGYLANPKLSAEKFIPNPFSKIKGERMYKSGDLTKYTSTGEIEFIGRIDNQIKLRGFRIELGEIESVISSFPNVNDNIVILRKDNPEIEQLVAYITLLNGDTINLGELKAFLNSKLPGYMVPKLYVTLDKFPLSPSKKIDYNLLPKPDQISKTLTNAFVEPKTEIEITISNIGKELLGIERMGINDNFFELGGHSLLATQFVSRIKEELNKEISLKQLFDNPTITDIASAIEASEGTDVSQNDKILKQDRGEDNLLDLLGEIENMTDEEAKLFLENEDGTVN